MKKYLVLLGLSVVLFACEKEKTIDNTPPATAEGLANAVYGPLQTLSSSYSFLLESATETAISFEGADDKEGPLVSAFKTQPNNWYAIKVFNRLYKSIGAANLAIEKIGDNTQFTEEFEDNEGRRAQLVARSKFIRGYDYFQLVQLYGEVPLILSSGSNEKSRASIDDVYKQIVQDLTEAAAVLEPYEPAKSDPSQAAVNAILAKVYLTWGSKPITSAEIPADATDPAKPAVDVAKLSEAIRYANLVIANSNYSLVTPYNKIWGVSNENNSEVIFSIRHDGDGIDAQGNHQTHCGFTWPKSAITDPHISYADITLEDAITAPDDRRGYSYATSVKYADNKVDQLTWPTSIVRPGKWIHRDANEIALDQQPNNIDHIDFRLAEVLLIKAEALFFTGNAADATTEVNKVRTRANAGTLTGTITEEELYKEWQNEFAFEQKHWLNIVRWRTLIKSVKKVANYTYFGDAYATEAGVKALDANANAPFYVRVHNHLHSKFDNVKGKFYRFPIPTGEKGEDLGIKPQNPGY